MLVFVFDVLRPPRCKRRVRRPIRGGPARWNGPRAIHPSPGAYAACRRSASRYPLWQQKGLAEEIAAGRFYLPDAEEGKRETMVTGVLDAEPIQVLRVPHDSFQPMIAAALVGGCFIAATFHWWAAAAASGIAGIAALVVWLWTGTAVIPEKPAKPVGMGEVLPLYASGSLSVGWWAMFITMVGDGTAFLSLVFGYFYYWTIHPIFPPEHAAGPEPAYPLAAAGVTLAAWALMLWARAANDADRPGMLRLALAAVHRAGSRRRRAAAARPLDHPARPDPSRL